MEQILCSQECQREIQGSTCPTAATCRRVRKVKTRCRANSESSIRDTKDTTKPINIRDTKVTMDTTATMDIRDTMDTMDIRDTMETMDTKDTMNNIDSKDNMDTMDPMGDYGH